MTGCTGGKGAGTKYTYAQLEGLWIKAGGAKSLAPVMAAIATAESGGCSTAFNPSGATGLWQILGAVNPADQASLTDPATNAHEAVLKYKSQGLGAWTTYTSGAYKAYLSGSTTPDTNVPGKGSDGSTSGDVLDAADVSGNCLWGVSVPGGSTGGWIQGAIAAAGGGGAFGLASPASGKSSGICIVSRSAARAMLGGALLLAGSVVILPGVIILAAMGFRATGGPAKVMQAAALVPGVGAGVRVASAAGAAASGTVPQGRHARTGANAPAQGRHAAPAGP
jgi:hypothetical protein